jgi:predicted RNase H-like nuclease
MPTQLAVLGVDAAWTEKNPSGVALVSFANGKWECVALAPSYAQFLAFSKGIKIDWNEVPSGGQAAPDELLNGCRMLLQGQDVTVVAVDMPISRGPIVGRRTADTAISKEFGANKCATHSPSPDRPGTVSRFFCESFARLGYGLKTMTDQRPTGQSLIEVYPHPALLRLLGDNERLKYKANKTSQYWKRESLENRRNRLLSVWARILDALKLQIGSIPHDIPKDAGDHSLNYLKRFEDALDALVCAWVGIMFIEGKATAFGDEESAIWVPERR